MRLLLIALLAVFLGALPAGAVNNFQRSPWLIDTAGATPITGSINVTHLRWVNVAAPGDKLLLFDTTGRKLFEATCPTGATEFELVLPFATNKGIVVNRIDSGLLYLGFQ